MKINCDRGSCYSNGSHGIGIVIRNCQGSLMDEYNELVMASSSIKTEAFVFKRGLNIWVLGK